MSRNKLLATTYKHFSRSLYYIGCYTQSKVNRWSVLNYSFPFSTTWPNNLSKISDCYLQTLANWHAPNNEYNECRAIRSTAQARGDELYDIRQKMQNIVHLSKVLMYLGIHVVLIRNVVCLAISKSFFGCSIYNKLFFSLRQSTTWTEILLFHSLPL